MHRIISLVQNISMIQIAFRTRNIFRFFNFRFLKFKKFEIEIQRKKFKKPVSSKKNLLKVDTIHKIFKKFENSVKKRKKYKSGKIEIKKNRKFEKM